MTRIYLVTNIDNNPFKVYIGKTVNNRKNNHELKYGKQIIYSYIDEIDSLLYEDWKPLECYWIEQFKQWGFKLENKNKGGGGPPKWSEELINSEKNLLRIEKIKNNKERGLKISSKTKNRPLSESHKANLRVPKSITYKKGPLSRETKDKIGKALKGRKGPNKGGKLKEETKLKIIKSKEKYKIPILQYDLEGNFIKEWPSQTDACLFLNVKLPYLNNALNRSKTGISCNYKWKYKNE